MSFGEGGSSYLGGLEEIDTTDLGPKPGSIEWDRDCLESTCKITAQREESFGWCLSQMGPDDDPNEVIYFQECESRNRERRVQAEAGLARLGSGSIQVVDASGTLGGLGFSDEINTSTESFMEGRNLDREEDENQVTELVANGFNMGLNEEEVGMLVDGSYTEDNLNNLPEERREEFIGGIKELDDGGLLDGENEGGYDEGDLSKLLKSLGINLNGDGNFESMSFEGHDLKNVPEELKPVLETAFIELNNNESDRSTDKYFKETGFGNLKTDSTPWCTAFVNWVLKQSGFEMTGSNAAKSFIEGSGFGHVGFKVGEGLLGGNQSDMVCIKPLNLEKIAGWALPTKNSPDGKDFEIHKKEDPDFDINNIPDGAIIVYNRSTTSSSDKQYG